MRPKIASRKNVQNCQVSHAQFSSLSRNRHRIGRPSRRPWRHLFFLAASAARRAAHTRHKADGNTAGGVPSPGRRNAGIVPWTSVPWTYSHNVKTSGSRVLCLRRSTRSKASRRSIMLLQVLRRLDRLGVVVPTVICPNAAGMSGSHPCDLGQDAGCAGHRLQDARLADTSAHCP